MLSALTGGDTQPQATCSSRPTCSATFSSTTINRRCKLEQRPFHRGAGQLRRVRRAGNEQCVAGWHRAARRIIFGILKTCLLAGLHHLHQHAERIEAAWKACVTIKLHQDFSNLADRQTGIHPLIQRSSESVHVRCSSECRSGYDRLPPGGQRFAQYSNASDAWHFVPHITSPVPWSPQRTAVNLLFFGVVAPSSSIPVRRTDFPGYRITGSCQYS